MSSMMRMPANEACYLDLPIDGNKINFASPSKLTLEKFCQKKTLEKSIFIPLTIAKRTCPCLCPG